MSTPVTASLPSAPLGFRRKGSLEAMREMQKRFVLEARDETLVAIESIQGLHDMFLVCNGINDKNVANYCSDAMTIADVKDETYGELVDELRWIREQIHNHIKRCDGDCAKCGDCSMDVDEQPQTE